MNSFLNFFFCFILLLEVPKGAFYSQPDRPRIPLDNRPGILKPNEVCEYIFLVLFIYMQTNAGAVVIDAIGSLIGFKRANRLANRGFIHCLNSKLAIFQLK